MRTAEQVVQEIFPGTESVVRTELIQAISTGKLVVPFTGTELEKLIKDEEKKSFRYCIPLLDLIKALQIAQKEIR